MPHNRFRAELALIVPALFIAFVLWVIAKQGDMDTDWLVVPLRLENVPPIMEITPSPPEVQLKFQFPEELRNRVLPRNFSIPIDAAQVFTLDPAEWSPASPVKESFYPLTPRSILRQNAPPTVQVVQIAPEQVQLSARLRSVTTAIDIVTTGRLPANLKLSGPLRSQPENVTVTGTPEALDRLTRQQNRIATAPIDLAQIQSSGQKYPTLQLPEGISLVGRSDRTITVDIGITEGDVSMTYEQVPVSIVTFDEDLVPRIQPAAVSVEVSGPESRLDELNVDDIEVVPVRDLPTQEGAQEVGVEARLKDRVAAPIARQVNILRCIPSSVTVEFIPPHRQNGSSEPVLPADSPAPGR